MARIAAQVSDPNSGILPPSWLPQRDPSARFTSPGWQQHFHLPHKIPRLMQCPPNLSGHPSCLPRPILPCIAGSLQRLTQPLLSSYLAAKADASFSSPAPAVASSLPNSYLVFPTFPTSLLLTTHAWEGDLRNFPE